MSDPFEALRQTPTPDGALSPAEVRSRGDRLRRRRTTLQVVGSAVAVVVIAGGAFGLSGQLDRADTSPAPINPPTESSSPMVIPADYQLAEGWPEPTETDGDNGIKGPGAGLESVSFSVCGESFGSAGQDTDRLTATFVQPEDHRSREIRTYGSEDAAAAALEELVARFEACPSYAGDGPPEWTTLVVPQEGRPGVQVLGYAGSAQGAAVGVSTVNFVQRGQALLISTTSSEASGPEAAQQQADLDRAALATAEAGMCVFTAAGCGPDEESSPPSLAAFPGTAGWPEDATAPIEEFKNGPEPFSNCGLRIGLVPEPIVWRGWHRSGGENVRSRQVFVFEDEAIAVALLDDAEKQACRSIPMEAPNELVGEVTRSPLGEGAEVVTSTTWYEAAGQPIIGGIEATHVVRHGRAVLVSNYGAQGTGSQPAADEAAADLASMTEVLEALAELG